MIRFLSKINKITWIVLGLCVAIFIGLIVYANSIKEDYEANAASYTTYETAKVTSVAYEDLSVEELYENSEVGSQQLMIEITSGEYKGMLMSAVNYVGALYGTHLYEGDKIVVAIYISEGEVNSITVYEYNRQLAAIILLLAFVTITVAIGRKKGAQSLIGLFFTIVCLIWILIPLLFAGANTILATFLICVYVAVVTYTLLEGVTKKTVCAMLGTLLGLVLAIIFGLMAQSLFKVHGMRMGDYVDALLQLKQGGTPIQLKGLLIGGMIVSSLGAIMDVAMSIASAVQELVRVNPKLTRKEIWKSGMNIGQDMIGTMTNTLILAFFGSSFVMVLYIYSLNVPVYELLSSTLVATQLVHGVASSIGVVLSVPLTVLIATLMYGGRNE